MTVPSAWGALEAAIERYTGKTVGELRGQTIDQRRVEVEKRCGRKFSVKKYFPLIGRGNVLRDHVVDSETIEKDLKRILG